MRGSGIQRQCERRQYQSAHLKFAAVDLRVTDVGREPKAAGGQVDGLLDVGPFDGVGSGIHRKTVVEVAPLAAQFIAPQRVRLVLGRWIGDSQGRIIRIAGPSRYVGGVGTRRTAQSESLGNGDIEVAGVVDGIVQ